MFTDKEYPATHSMATSWYIVDDDDNVGIMQFDDNGPVPFGINQDCSYANNLIFGELLNENEMAGSINFKAEQLHDLLGEPHLPIDEKNWFDIVVEIDKNKKDFFFSIIENSNSKIVFLGCISEIYGLYKIDVWKCTDDNSKIIKGSALDKLITSKIILNIYGIPEFEMDCDYNSELGDFEFKCGFGEVPYYIYLQPYWPSNLQRRMNIPKHPIKLSQIEYDKRGEILRIPGKFKDMENMQIATWYPSELVVSFSDEEVAIEDNRYTLLPMMDGTKSYVLTGAWEFDFCHYCPNPCNKKGHFLEKNCAVTFSRTNIVAPTVLFIISPLTDYYQRYHEYGFVKQLKKKMLITSYVGRILKIDGNEKWESAEEIAKKLSFEELLAQFKASHAWLDHVVETLNPRVIILSDNALDVFSEVYIISNNKVDINNHQYPIYKESDFEKEKEEIIRLSNLPYQGKVVRTSYSEEEVKRLKSIK